MWNRYRPDPFVGAAHAVSTTLTPTVVTSSAVNSPVATSPPARRIAVRGKIHWEYMVPITLVHGLACFALLPWCFSWSGLTLALIGTNFFGTLGINLCYHRLLAHRSLKVPRWLERTFATIAVCSMEDTPARWVATHRMHHMHSDETEDPHSPRDGVAWSHAGWLFRRAPGRRTLTFLEKYARDILADSYYRFLERRPTTVLYIYLAHAAAFGLVGFLVGRFTGGDWQHGRFQLPPGDSAEFIPAPDR